jgi:crossover junction endodeoxyribonuclease RuvC
VTAFAGIDPGKDGAVAIISSSGRVTIVDTPTVSTGKGSRQAYDESAMAKILFRAVEENGGCVFALEQVHSMPGQGVSSMFSMGEGFGLWKGILAALRVPWTLVTPQRWKGALMDGQAKEKAASALVAGRLFPAVAGELAGPRGRVLDGRADALLIAEYLRRTHGVLSSAGE